MAAGLVLAELERNYLRVLRMIGLMVDHRPKAFDDRINKFNIIMNLGHRLALEFESEFGGIQCRQIVGCDFSSLKGVESYLRRDGPAKCERIAAWVAGRLSGVVAAASGGTSTGELLGERASA